MREDTGNYPFESKNTLEFAETASKQYLWKPQPDITTYELALCVEVMLVHWKFQCQRLEALPYEAKRHWEEVT